MQDNAPSRAAKNSKGYRQRVGFSGGRLVEWPIEDLWSILKMRVYQDGRQFSSRVALCNAIVDAAFSRAQ